MLGIDVNVVQTLLPPRARPGDWLERSPVLNLLLVALGTGWLLNEISGKGLVPAISNLNTYNLLFLMLGMLLHWRPRSFVDAVAKAVPATAGVLIQFPLYGAIATIMTGAKGFGGHTVAGPHCTRTVGGPVGVTASIGAVLTSTSRTLGRLNVS